MRATIQPFTGQDLETATASQLMTPNPVSIHEDATVEEVIAFLADKRYGASPVIDEAGHHLGVVSRSDILRYDRERAWLPPSAGPQGGQSPRARDLMTPAVFSVKLDTPAARVAEQMVELNVHRLFVVDDTESWSGSSRPWTFCATSAASSPRAEREAPSGVRRHRAARRRHRFGNGERGLDDQDGAERLAQDALGHAAH